MTTNYDFLANPKLPSREAIVAQAEEARNVDFPLRDAESGSIIAWVKHGSYVTVYEAQTQDFVARELAQDRTAGSSVVQVPRVFDAFEWQDGPGSIVGCIVMEYVEGNDCQCTRDANDVAPAVQRLISIRGPDITPGHLGGGDIVHSFFWIDGNPPIHYHSVQDFQDHINNILKHKKDPRRIDIVSEAQDGLFLCPCDISPKNFRRRSSDGQLFATGFRMACFLPRSFFVAALHILATDFCIKVARKLTIKQPKDAAAIVDASGYLIIYAQPVGLPKHLRAQLKKSPR
ncbi:hypothetical protein FB45DRAFT_805854 [Roridomyces roridus]|uniref:Uncharacterized protein n=1 Tax=Roridomyces roridus TaxID=1738132 RepID=A0AAD7B393_9AGAR|nr:hypothetical protein FB45DRAFT_805854 [Roridomyces roridus]